MSCEVPVQQRYEQLLDGTLEGPERAAFAAHLRGCGDCADVLGEVDEGERDLVLSLLWADGGGVDADLPDFPVERARAAANEGMDRREGRNVVRFRRPLTWVAVVAAAAAVLLLMQPAEAPPDLQARGAETPTLGAAIDLSEWNDGVPGRPVLAGDTLGAGASLAVEWTNPPRSGGAFRYLAVVARSGGRWWILGQRPIGVVAEDDQGPVFGPVKLGGVAGAVEVCGVFSHRMPASDALTAGAFPGPRVCTRLNVE